MYCSLNRKLILQRLKKKLFTSSACLNRCEIHRKCRVDSSFIRIPEIWTVDLIGPEECSEFRVMQALCNLRWYHISIFFEFFHHARIAKIANIADVGQRRFCNVLPETLIPYFLIAVITYLEIHQEGLMADIAGGEFECLLIQLWDHTHEDMEIPSQIQTIMHR